LQPFVFIFIIAFIQLLLLLHLLLFPRPFINESVKRIVNQLVFVCHVLIGMKITLLIELGFWRRFAMV